MLSPPGIPQDGMDAGAESGVIQLPWAKVTQRSHLMLTHPELRLPASNGIRSRYYTSLDRRFTPPPTVGLVEDLARQPQDYSWHYEMIAYIML